jgi:hypothetical protein
VTTVREIFNYKTPEEVGNMRCAELGALAVDRNRRGKGVATRGLAEILSLFGANGEDIRDPFTRAEVIFAELTPASNGAICNALKSNDSRWHTIAVGGGVVKGVMRTVVAFSLNKALIEEMKTHKEHGKEWISLQEHMDNPGRAAGLSSAARTPSPPIKGKVCKEGFNNRCSGRPSSRTPGSRGLSRRPPHKPH